MELTKEQKIQLIEILKEGTDNFTYPIELRAFLPVKVGEQEILDSEGNPTGEKEDIIEDHQFAFTTICIQRHDMTAEKMYPIEYINYELL